MLLQRVLTAIVLLPLGLAAIWVGGQVFAGVVALILVLASWEYTGLMRAGGVQAARWLVPACVLLIVGVRFWAGFAATDWLLSLVVLVLMARHLAAYERGRGQAATDFAASLAGALYVGWLGAYLISLRSLPEGEWWVLLALPAIWLADSAAYFAGRRFGRRKLAPRLSPNKTWEGYLSGILVGTLGAAGLAALWEMAAGPGTAITPGRGALLGVALAVLAPLGDLAESMIKRQMGVKDSSHLIPGHGGALDRIDSWLWGAVLAYYFIVWLFLPLR